MPENPFPIHVPHSLAKDSLVVPPTKQGPPFSPWHWFLAAILAAGGGLRAWLSVQTDFSIGDAYIGFRFAEQFAQGNGLVFNAGEWVGGNTSLLYSFLLGLGTCTGLSTPWVARLIGIACDIGIFLLTWKLLRENRRIASPFFQAAIPTLVFLCPFLFFYSVSGMETSFYLLAIMFLLDRTLKGLDWIWHLAVGILFFSRPDGIIVVIAALSFVIIQTRKLPWKALIITFFIGIAYLGFNLIVYDSLIPLTVKVKAVVFHKSAIENFEYIADRFFFHRSWLLAIYAGALILLTFVKWKRPAVLLFGLNGIFYFVFLLFAPYLRTWYVVPFLTLSAPAILISLASLAEKQNTVLFNRLGWGFLVIYLAASCYAYRLVFRECAIWRGRIRDEQEAAGTWLKNNTDPNAKVFVTALETGYFSKRYTLDHPGLVSPQVLQLIQSGKVTELLDIADHLQMDYAVIPDDFQTNAHRNFRRVKVFCTERSAAHFGLNKNCYSVFERLLPIEPATQE